MFSYLAQEEDRCNLMTQPQQPIIDQSALVSSSCGGRGSYHSHGGVSRGGVSQDNRDKLKCEHCGCSRHTKEMYWDLHGRPRSSRITLFFIGGRGGFCSQTQFSVNFVTSSTEPASTSTPYAMASLNVSFSCVQIEILRRFMANLEPSTSTFTSSFSQSDALAYAFSASVTAPNNSWIIDSGALDHMTSMPSLFSSYSVYSVKDKVCVVDGYYSSIVGKGSISITPTLPLSLTLHVPKFSFNLLFVSHITKTLNCYVTFFHFQDLGTRTIIGKGHEENGLYILDSAPHIATSIKL